MRTDGDEFRMKRQRISHRSGKNNVQRRVLVELYLVWRSDVMETWCCGIEKALLIANEGGERPCTAEVRGSNPLGSTLESSSWPSTPCRLWRQPNNLLYQGERRRTSSASKRSIRKRCSSSSCRSRSRSPRRTTMLPTSSARCGLSPKGSGAPCLVSRFCASSDDEDPCDVPRGAVKSLSSQSSPASVTV
jgi:hypothetical protein